MRTPTRAISRRDALINSVPTAGRRNRRIASSQSLPSSTNYGRLQYLLGFSFPYSFSKASRIMEGMKVIRIPIV